MQGKILLLIDDNHLWILSHELFDYFCHFFIQSSSEHQHLFFVIGLKEDFLHCLSHVVFFKNLVTFINNKEFELVSLNVLLLYKSQHSSRGSDHDLRRSVLELQYLSFFIYTSVDLSHL